MTKQYTLFMPPNWLGDVVMAQPAMRALYMHDSEAQIVLFGHTWLQDLLPFLNLGQALYSHELTQAKRVFIFRNSFSAAWQAWRAGIPHRYGFRHEGRGFLLNHAFKPALNMQHEHHRLYFLDLAKQAGANIEQQNVSLIIPDAEQQAGQALLEAHQLDYRRTICIAPGAQFGAAKRYPSNAYAQVIKKLSSDGWHIVILGTDAERDIGEQCLADSVSNTWNAAGQTSLRQALQIVCSARLMLCNDSGLMHVAAGMGKATVGIFGATSPERTAPSGEHVSLLYRPANCSPCLKRECHVQGQPCMQNITPEMVYQSCQSLLNV